MISVSVDPQGDTDVALENLMKTYGAPYSSKNQWLFARDTAGMASLYEISGVPTVIIIDADGRIVQVNTGEVSLETLIQQIEFAQSY
jgi:cytochrome oxidase Cu insertion factor (SCO1/SenC/PrrC family)